ncbi:MAG: flotillin-like FloA family protein [Planctomycetales bacterium]|jgi:uncharacterized protein YqfA (UPF0365 family)|nr:flotillin-like FloA family protein [Planctomycetales bacterium]|tara:strand:+ start:1873 stop:2247 length:375 start_codon:yes stop_codon:yes gene_type:complete
MQFPFVVMAGVLVGAIIPMLVLFLFVVRPWIRGRLYGVNISLVRIILMRIRRSDVNQVMDCLIMALQSGVSISVDKMEQADAQQVDLKKVTLAMIESERQGLDLEFDELVEAELGSRLAETLAE